MDFRERLLRNDIRHLSDNLRAVSEELMFLQSFVKYEFATQFKAFTKLRAADDSKNSNSSSKSTALQKVQSKDRPTSIFLRSRSKRKTAATSLFHQKRQKRNVEQQQDVPDNNMISTSVQLERLHQDDNTFPGELECNSENEIFELPSEEYKPNIFITAVHGSGDAVDNPDSDQENKTDDEEFSAAISYIDDESDANSDEGKRKQRATTNKSKTNTKSDKDDSDEDDNLGERDSDPEFILPNTGSKTKRKLRKTPSKDKAVQHPSRCPVCQVEVEKSGFTHHITLEHSEEQTDAQFICRVCGKIYECKESFLDHKKTGHSTKTSTTDGKDKCNYCGFLCGDNYKRIVHERKHTKEKPYSCSQCGMAFSRTDNLRRHLRKHSLKDLKCSFCNYKTISKEDMSRHLNSHNRYNSKLNLGTN